MPDISTPNLDYNDMVEAWDINDALMAARWKCAGRARSISLNGRTKILKVIRSVWLRQRYSCL